MKWWNLLPKDPSDEKPPLYPSRKITFLKPFPPYFHVHEPLPKDYPSFKTTQVGFVRMVLKERGPTVHQIQVHKASSAFLTVQSQGMACKIPAWPKTQTGKLITYLHFHGGILLDTVHTNELCLQPAHHVNCSMQSPCDLKHHQVKGLNSLKAVMLNMSCHLAWIPKIISNLQPKVSLIWPTWLTGHEKPVTCLLTAQTPENACCCCVERDACICTVYWHTQKYCALLFFSEFRQYSLFHIFW